MKREWVGLRGGEFVRGEIGPFPTRGEDPGWQVNGNEGVTVPLQGRDRQQILR